MNERRMDESKYLRIVCVHVSVCVCVCVCVSFIVEAIRKDEALRKGCTNPVLAAYSGVAHGVHV